MFYLIMNFNGFKYERLSAIRKNSVATIPVDYGIYKWVYWPKFSSTTISTSDLMTLLKKYTAQNFYIEEELTGLFKFHAKIWEQGFKDNSNVFGLSSSKQTELFSFLSTRSNLTFFSEFFKEVCFARPFYLGKANNLNARLKSHIAGKSQILPDIIKKGIPENDIWVGFKIIPSIPTSPLLNTIFEEIYTRKVKPGLSIKPN